MASLPKISVPAARSSAPVLAIRRRIILGLLVAAIALSLLAILISANRAPAPTGGPSTATPTVAFAEEIARDYLNGQATDAPVAAGVDATFGYDKDSLPFQWSGLNLATITPVSYGVEGKKVQLVNYYVQLAQPQKTSEGEVVSVPRLYRLTIPMVDPGNSYPRLAAQPSLGAVNLNDGSRGTVNGMNVSDVEGARPGSDVSEEVKSSLTEWAYAFAGGGDEDSRLKMLTRDDRPEAQYSGLGGWTVEDLQVLGVLPAPNEGDPGFVVRVALALTPPAGTGPTTTTEYDVWVAQTQAGQANPPVIAWGSPGTSKNMTPYQNAVVPNP